MIKVSRLNHAEFVVNAEMIEFIEATPDTIITLINGKKIVVRESVEEIIEKVIAFKRMIGCNFFDGRISSINNNDENHS